MRRWGRRLAAVGTTAALLVPAAAWAGGSGDGSGDGSGNRSGTRPANGSAGMGDPYYPKYGNGGYDVKHYGINVSYRPKGDRLRGVTVVRARATQRLRRFDLDLVLRARSVRVNGVRARFSQGSHELVVTPRRAIAKGGLMRVVVRYAGRPSRASYAGVKPWTHNAHGAAAIGQPEIAPWWFPSNDHPRDKATYDVRVRVAKRLQALGNGRLVSSRVHGSKRVWHWRERKPMASYLAFFVVGRYDLFRGRTASGLPFVNAVPKGSGLGARRTLARTPGVIAWESRLWGPYPFDAVGGVVTDLDLDFALENQSRPVYSGGSIGSGDIYLIVHENAHQWFGDSVSVSNWRDAWLNEGFATFTEWMWSELHGDGSAQQRFADTYSVYPRTGSFWRLRMANPGKHHEFDDPIYDRGAMTLQALRNRIGNGAFFRVMRRWAAEHRYGNGSTPQFVALAERVSGQDLSGFFHAWLYARSRPAATAANGFPAGLDRLQQRSRTHGTLRRAERTLREAERRVSSGSHDRHEPIGSLR